MHDWSEQDIDWKGISAAAQYIGLGLRIWGRVPVRDYKEKYGTIRVYCSFGWWSIHDITHPGWAYIQYKSKLLRYLNYAEWFNRIFRLVNWVVVPYHTWLYTYLYGQALRKWPHLRLEILTGADFPELLRKHGVHQVRTGKNFYEIHYDWHEDNYVYPEKDPTICDKCGNDLV